jgi:hypothetical protein
LTSVREVRILIKHRGMLRQVCKLAFSQIDASLYLFPYAAQGRYYYGSRSLGEKQMQDTFDFTAGFVEDMVPKLSIHETGQVHVFAGKERAGPLQIPPLETLLGQHVATVVPDAFVALKPFLGAPRETGSELDHVIPAADVVENGRLAIYVNGAAPAFDVANCRLTLTLSRPTLARPLHIGIKAIPQAPLGGDTYEGVTVIAGWDPTLSNDAPMDFLYVRGR